MASLGRAEDLQADGKLDVLSRSDSRLSETALLSPTTTLQPWRRVRRSVNGIRPTVGINQLPVRDRISGRGTQLRLLARTRGVCQCAASVGGVRLGSGLREVARQLSDRGDRASRVAPALPRHGLAWRGWSELEGVVIGRDMLARCHQMAKEMQQYAR